MIAPPPWLFSRDQDLLKQFPFNLPLPDHALNRTEEFDEDDPSLFYPPPYSFVYKINYTNLAPVGPLVPGIILPPPPDFFSVYDPEGDKKPVKTPIDVINRIKDIHLKNRLSASSTSTTVAPFKSSTFSTTLREFTSRNTKVPSTSPSTRLYKSKLTTLRAPVPTYATTLLHSSTSELMKPIHPFETTTLRVHPVYVPTSGTTQLFSTTTVAPPPAIVKPYKQDYGTQAHPIYFEYFDARTATPVNPFVGPEYENTYSHPSTLQSPPTKGHSKKPKSFYQPQFLSSTISPHPQNVDTKYLFVTPKPELHYGTVLASPQPYAISTDSPLSYNSGSGHNSGSGQQKPLVLKPVGRFEDEIAAIRQTLDFYNGKKFVQKAPKVKAVYEFSFEASKHKNQDDFKPMLSYDQKNYYSPKPEINYSHLSELIKTNGYYPTTTETVKYYRAKQSATLPPKKSQETSASPQMAYGQKLRPQSVNYYVRPIFKEVASSQQSQKIINYPSSSYDTQSQPINVDQGYRLNNRNVKYRKPQHQSQQQQQFYGQAGEVASLLNDTLVNYRQPQRPINPYSEFIDLSRFPQNQPQFPQNSPPYPQQHQIPIQHPLFPGYQRPIQQQPYHQHYEFPQIPQIPQINPESVHITFYNRPMEKSNDNYYVTPRN